MADFQMETCHSSKIKIVKVESYLEQSSQSNILFNALADHEMKLEASQKDCNYESVYTEKEEDLFDKDFWENLCKKENNPKGFSNSSEDGDANESISSYLMTDLEENNTKNCYLDDTSSKDGINYNNSDNDSDFDDNELDYLPLSSVMNDHTYMCTEVNVQGNNYIISKSEDLKKTINSYLAGKIKKENKNAVDLDTFVNSIMKKISAFDAETDYKTTSICPNAKLEAGVAENIEEKSYSDNDESNKNNIINPMDSNFKFPSVSEDLNQSCEINPEAPNTLKSKKESNADSNGNNSENEFNIPDTQNSEYKTENSDTDNDFKPLSSLSLTNDQIFGEPLKVLEENCDNTKKNIMIGGEENDNKNSITNHQSLLSKSSIDSEIMSMKQLSDIAKKISEDCLLFDTSKSQFDNEQFAIAKLEEFKNHVFELCKITSTEMGIQTEKVVSKKMLRKMNEKEKRMLLQESSSNDSSSSYYDNDDDEETNSSFSNDDIKRLKRNLSVLSERASDQSFESLVNASSRNSSDSRHEIVSATTALAEAISSTSGSKEMDGVESETMAFNDGPNRFPNIKFDSKVSAENLGSSLLQEDCENLEFNEGGKLLNTKESTSDIKTEMSDLLSFDDGNKKRNSDNSLIIKPLEEMTKDEIEQYEDNERDKQIEKLIDFKGLSKRKESLGYTSNEAVKSKIHKAKKSKNFFDILDECDEPLSDESLSQEEKEIMTEKQYLKKCNENFKQQLLDSSSDSELAEESPDDLKKLLETDEEDEEHPPLVEKFLESFDSNNIDNVNENDDHEDQSNSLSSDNNEKIKSLLDTEIVGSAQIKEEKNELDISSPKSPKSDTPTSAIADGSSDCEILDDTLKKKTVRPKSLDKLLADADRRKKISLDSEFISLSSDSDTDTEEQPNEAEESASKRFLKPMLRQDQLAGGTRTAQKQENSRLSRLEKKHQTMTKAIKDSYTDIAEAEKEVILDYNTDNKTFIKVHPDVVKHLKPHQVEGVKFMYDNCYGSVEHLKKHPGSGCILAHCMGLGKTLQLIALLHTVISYRDLKTSKVLVLCPKSTVMNWADEVQRWVGSVKSQVNLRVYSFSDTSDINEKLRVLEEWSLSGSAGCRKAGVLLIGYEAFRTLVFFHSYKKKRILPTSQIENIKDKIKKSLLEPGADLVVCDEGHIIKNEKSAISLAVAEIRTPRRIVLTGTPIQNNLKEYYSMVNFIKPSFLGTSKEFANLYANPIKNGQHKDSSKRDIKVMKQRSFVLHKKLSKFVQRKEAALLKSFLPQKFEYVLFLPLTDVQVRLYERILEVIAGRVGSTGKSLITDYTCFRKIWTHPKVLENAWKNAIQGKNKRDARRIQSNNDDEDDQPDDIYDRQTGVMSVTNDWWRQYVTQEDLESILPSTKLRTMFEIIRMCEENGEKCLIFSAFVAVLNVVEDFLNKLNKKDLKIMNDLNPNGLPGRFRSSWINGVDYYRLDGKTPKTIRHEMIKSFNNSNNTKARVFLISAKAGGQGINLIGANRVIILDTSWNPSNDQQNIFRIFRLGQKKNCYVYRLLAMGTMEEKVYSRSVTKQAMSFRVVDEQQIERHYNMEELTALYTLTKPDYGERPTPTVPQDNILANLVRNHPQLVYKYHEHDSLLENKVEQELSEQEKADAWAAYENELKAATEPTAMFGPYDGLHPNFGMTANGNYNPGVGGYNPLNYPFGLASQLAGYNFPVSNGSYLDILNSMYSQFPSSPLMYSGMGSPYNSSMLPSTSNPLTNPNVASLLHNVANPLTALGSLAFNGMDASTRITNSGNNSSTYAQPMFSTAALPYPLTGSSGSPNLTSSLGISPNSILESFQRRQEGISSNIVNKNIPPVDLFARTSLPQNVRPTQVQQSTINVTKPPNIEQTLTSPVVAVSQTVSQTSTTQSSSLSSLPSQQRITVRSPSSMTLPVVASSNVTLPQNKLLGKPNSPPQSAANVPSNSNNSKNALGESIPISVIQKSDASIKAVKDNNTSSIQIASKQTSSVNNSIVGNKLPPLSGLEGTKLTNVVSLKTKSDSSRQSNMGITYPNRNSPKPAAASPGNIGIVYPKNVSPQSVSGQIKTSSPTIKTTGSSMQIIPTRNTPQDSISKQLEQISPSISLTAVNPQNKTTFRPVRSNQNSNLIIKSVNSTTADSPLTTPQKSIKTRVVTQQNAYQKKPMVSNVEKKITSPISPTSTTYFTPTISPSRNQPISKQITVKRNVVENIQKPSIANTKLLQNQALSKVQQSQSLQTINTRTGQSPQAAAVLNKRIQNTMINKNAKPFESPNKAITTINKAPYNLQKQNSPNNNLNNKRVLGVGSKGAQFVTENKQSGSTIQKPQQLRPLIKRIELNPTSLAAVKNSINSNPTAVSKSPQPGVLIIDKNSKNTVNGMSYNNFTGAKSGGATITRVVNVNKRPAGPTNLNDSPTQGKRAKFSDFLPTSPKYSNTVSESLRKVQATNSLTIVPSISSQTLKVVNKKAPPAEIVELD